RRDSPENQRLILGRHESEDRVWGGLQLLGRDSQKRAQAPVGADHLAADHDHGGQGQDLEEALQLLTGHRSALRSPRLSPMRSVSFSRSKYSSRGMANFRVSPVSSLNDCASIDPCCARCERTRLRSSISGVAPYQRSSLTLLARPAPASALS